MTASLLTAINRLARVCATVKAGEVLGIEDREWLVTSLERYFAEAQLGLTLEAAFDLAPGPGGTTWWAMARRRQRDALLRGLADYHFAGLPAPEAAREILVAWRRYGRRQLSVDLLRGESAAAARTLESDFFILAGLGGLPQEKRVTEILIGAEQPEGVQAFETV